MTALRVGRDVAAPDWVIGAGAIRDVVFDHLHGNIAPLSRDIDYAYFDPRDQSAASERSIERALQRRAPGLPFEARNQARVHLWYEAHFGNPIEPYESIEHAISMWPETATAVALRLLADETIQIIAPFGLRDLFECVLRRNPAQVTRAIFRARLRRHPEFPGRWPRLRIVDDSDPEGQENGGNG
jgi:hypothetical protein